jgi:anti-anti-sigma regulatory factor
VGSSGIGAFVNTLREFSKNSVVAPRFCQVRSEFRKVFKATDESAFRLFEDEKAAVISFVEEPASQVMTEILPVGLKDSNNL